MPYFAYASPSLKMDRPKTARSFLFVPASRPDRFLKAQNSGADTIILDLEDTVCDDEKPSARQAVLEFGKESHQRFWVRVNNNDELNKDLEVLINCQNLAGIILPKVVNSHAITTAFNALNSPIIAVIESPKGLINLSTIAQTQGILALGFGLLDLGNSLGISPNSTGADVMFNKVRSELVLYSSVYGLARPIETIFPNFKDTDTLIKTATHAYTMGFGGQFAIHPAQVGAINRTYQPSDDERAFAQKIATHFHKTEEFAFAVDGIMVDLPLIDWAIQVSKTVVT